MSGPADRTNERTLRHEVWRRYDGDDWQAFDALPPGIRRRVSLHGYNAWSVNVLMLWRHYKRTYGRTARAEKALVRYLDYCERLECNVFATRYGEQYGMPLPHMAAQGTVQR